MSTYDNGRNINDLWGLYDVHLRTLQVFPVRLWQADKIDRTLLDHVQRRSVILKFIFNIYFYFALSQGMFAKVKEYKK